MAYTDLTSNWKYKGVVEWINMDAHAENSAKVYSMVNNSSFQAYDNYSQSFNEGVMTLIQFGTESFDADGIYDNSTYKFVPNRTGKWLIGAQLTFDNSAQGTQSLCAIYKNGVAYKYGARHGDNDVTAAREVSTHVLDIFETDNTTDYYQIYAQHTNNVAGTQSAWVTAAKFFAMRLFD